MAELLEKIPVEKRWAITAQAITRFSVLRVNYDFMQQVVR